MVVLLTGFMLDDGPTMVALIVLAIATVMIVTPPVQRAPCGAAGGTRRRDAGVRQRLTVGGSLRPSAADAMVPLATGLWDAASRCHYRRGG